MKLQMLAAFLIVTAGFEALANNQFIPNYYRNRRTLNSYSAIGWSNRNEASLEYKDLRENIEESGTETDTFTSNSFNATAFRRLSKEWNLEGLPTINKSRSEQANLANYDSRSETRLLAIGVGHEFSNAPMAIGVTGMRASTTTSYNQLAASTEYDNSTIGAGWGYRLAENIFVGFGYFNSNFNSTSSNSTSQIYSIGGGKVFGNLDSPIGALEMSLSRSDSNSTLYHIKGLVNSGNIQFYSSFSFTNSESTEEKSITAGLDYQVQSFYVGPQVGYVTSNGRRESELDLSLEGGYRTGQLEFFARVGRGETEYYPTDLFPDQKDKRMEFAIGGSYSF